MRACLTTGYEKADGSIQFVRTPMDEVVGLDLWNEVEDQHVGERGYWMDRRGHWIAYQPPVRLRPFHHQTLWERLFG